MKGSGGMKSPNKRKLKKMINSGFINLSSEDIRTLIEKEIDRGPDKCDTELIDLYFELLNMKEKSQDNIIKFKKTPKAVFVAAVLFALLISGIAVYANYYNNIPTNIVKIKDGNATLSYNLDNADITADDYKLLDTDFAKQLKSYGISPVTFPKELTNETCTLSNLSYLDDSPRLKNATALFRYNDIKVTMVIEQWNEDSDSAAPILLNHILSGKMLHVNGMDILVFEKRNSCKIFYRDNLTKYEIMVYSDFETTVKIVESIE